MAANSSDRVIGPKPPPGPIELSLEGKDANERARLKAQALVRSGRPTPWTTDDGITIRIRTGPQMRSNGSFEVHLDAVDADGRPLPVDNPYIFVNPPVKVPDGTWRKVSGPNDEQVDVPNFVEEPAAALKAIIAAAVSR